MPTSLLNAAIDAYANGNARDGDRYIEAAWRKLQPSVALAVRKVVRADEVDDATQGAFLKLWQAIRNWNPSKGPVENAEGIVRWLAHKAALNVAEDREHVHDHEVDTLDDPDSSDAIEFAAIGYGDGIEDDLALEQFTEYAAGRAMSARQADIWRRILEQVAEGHEDRGVIGSKIGLPAVSVRREIHCMRKVIDLRALNQRIGYRGWQADEAQVDAATGLGRLFDEGFVA